MNEELDLNLFEHIYTPIPGGISSKGSSKLLNGSKHSQIEVFLRESVQNSWDAKTTGCNSINFGLKGSYFSNEQLDFLKTTLTEAGNFGSITADKITSKSFNIEVSDSNTTGLTGSSRLEASYDTKTEEKFSHFVYLTGDDEMKSSSAGGSYGFGKSAIYRISGIRFIAIYTRIQNFSSKHFETRFILSRNDENIISSSDRCWWGKFENSNTKGQYATPLLNREADLFAKKIGMSLFAEEETGTRILVIGAKADENENTTQTIEEIFKAQLPVYITHWFWTKQITNQIHFNMEYCGKNITEMIPDPLTVNPYKAFSRAFKNYHRTIVDHQKITSPKSIMEIKCLRPLVVLGHVSLVTDEWDMSPYPFITIDWKKPTIALMRGVEFIVDYKQFSLDTNETSLSCFGIFHVDPRAHTKTGEKGEIDKYFRSAENQTHDCWEHPSTKQYNFVNKIESEIPEKIRDFLGIDEQLGNAGTISAIIAKKFGEKLVFGFGSGAKEELRESKENKQGSLKSNFRRINTPCKIDLVNGKKLISVFCEAKIIKNQILLVNLDCGIKTLDHSEGLLIDHEKLRITKVETTDKNDDRSFFIKMPIKIRKSGLYTVLIEAEKNCAFDLILKTEVLNG